MDREYSHVSFSDESNWNVGRYRAIGMLSGERGVALDLHRELAAQLQESDVKDFKWRKLKTAKHRFAAEKIVKAVLSRLSPDGVRVDVLCWDTYDKRHSVAGRDDVANLQRMYFHLFHNVMRLRWPSSCVWRHMPDEHTALDWNGVEFYLRRRSYTRVEELDAVCDDLVEDALFGTVLKKNFGVHEITACRSHEMAVCQAADLFAGAACFSRESYSDYKAWRAGQGYGDFLFDLKPITKLSHGDEEKYGILRMLESKIERMGLAIDVDAHKGFRTLNPRLPLNFWWYEPRSRHDKAPSTNRFPWVRD